MSTPRPVTPGGVNDQGGLDSRSGNAAPPLDQADQDVARRAQASPPSPRLAQRRALFAAAVTVAGVVLFLCYLQLSRTFLLSSDGSGNALQAWDMLHGNPLLRGWTLSDVSFYTTELPEYMLVELVHGLNAGVEHIAAALTYTLLVVLVALVAKGEATGMRAIMRMLVGAGILLSPQLGVAVGALLASPDHTGTTVPVLLAWLLVDRCRNQWWVPPLVAVLLAAAYIADKAALVIGIAPLLVVAGWRLYQRGYQRRPSHANFWSELVSARYELALIGAGLLALAAGNVTPGMIRHAGGYQLLPVPHTIAMSGSMITHIWAAADGVLTLFGANFFGMTLSFSTGLVLVHLVGVALAVWGVCAGLRRFAGDDLVSCMLAAGALLALVAFLIYPRVAGAHEMAAVLPFSAALAGRLVAERLAKARLEPVMAVVLCLYIVTLGVNIVGQPKANDYQPLASWLADHGLRYGLADYQFANSVTVASGNRVQIRPVQPPHHSLDIYPRMWEANKSWYDPSLHDATFLIQASGSPNLASVLQTFGRPARQYQVDGVTVLVWDYNLLTRTHWGMAWPVWNPSA